jgi:hypothetical protein
MQYINGNFEVVVASLGLVDWIVDVRFLTFSMTLLVVAIYAVIKYLFSR